ncbi:hypothetical protein BBD40_12440 [Paenibacillus ihbetae]|uniref:Lipoprotein n=2 Tax=Paenibacillus ihbetae TaxID=1870820 RepID=A0ABX3JZK5_9BACL|nr:hypothetical protein BBD40_12440 [Paenibacillus ihbetae]
MKGRAMKYIIGFILLILLMTGCSGKEANVPDLDNRMSKVFSYELNQVEPEHSEQVRDWLAKARQSGKEGQFFVHSFRNDTDEYMYNYVYRKGASDYEVSFIYSPDDTRSKGSVHVSGINHSANDSFVKIKLIDDLSIQVILSDDPLGKKLQDQ